jgi:hypothetical protein
LFGQAIPGQRLDDLDDAGMQQPPSLVKQAAIGNLVRQGMLEGVLMLREEAGLIEELGLLQLR